jgi:hypothetical protein
VFRVSATDQAAAPAVPPPLPPPLPPAAPAPAVDLENPFAGGPAQGSARAAPGAEGLVSDDPFAAAGFGTSVAAAPGPDPFAVPAPAPGDPFAAAAAAPGSELPDPFAASQPAAGPAEAGPLAVTDLSDLLASVPAPEAPAPAEVAPPPAAGIPPGGPADFDGGLSLEDRITPPPMPAAGRRGFDVGEGVPHTADPFGMDQGFGAYELGAGEEGASLALAGEPSPGPAAEAPPPAAPPAEAPPPLAAPLGAPGPVTPRPAAPALPVPEERVPRPRRSRLRAVVVNTIALAALLLVAGTMLAVWRSGGPLDAQALRPSRLLAALGHGSGAGPVLAQEIRSGAYERERGPPILFVRGKVVSRANAPISGVKVAVEVVRAEVVVARGEAPAGAVPTPEELFHAVDAAALATLAETVAARAPAAVRPGEALPFLVAIADHPADLEGASLRVEVVAAGAGGPGQ